MDEISTKTQDLKQVLSKFITDKIKLNLLIHW